MFRHEDRLSLGHVVLASTMALMVSHRADAQAFTAPTPLSVMYEVNVGGSSYTDFMTSVSASERNQFPLLGQFAYIQQETSSAPLYRLHYYHDHMDSQVAGEGGYSTDGALGSPWTTQTAVPGLAPITRLFNTSTGDHATVTPTTEGLFSGYQADANYGGRYGYQRFGNSSKALVTYSAGGITEGSDSVAGGAVASWIWNGQQFIDTHDYGRYMQSDVFIPIGATTYNPIEAGDIISGPTYGPTDQWHGSPVLQNQITNGVHVTRAIPLEYGLPGTGGYPITTDVPAVYTGWLIGKNLTLNYGGAGSVAKYETVIQTSAAVTGVTAEIPTAYLTAGVFTNFFTYEAGSNTLTAVTPPNGCTASKGLPFMPSSGKGGVILSNASGSYAMGVYGDKTTASGGPLVAYFALWNFGACGGVNKWSAVFYGNMAAGAALYDTYVVTGTLSTVVQSMYNMHVNGL